MAVVGGALAGFVGLGAPALGSAAFGGWAAGAAFATTIGGKLLGAVALSALSMALQPKTKAPKLEEPGIKTDYQLTGDVLAPSFVVGRYSTHGRMIVPPLTHGVAGDLENARLTYVVALGNVPGQNLNGVIVNGYRADTIYPDGTFGGTGEGEYLTIGGVNRGWIKYYDGTQILPDPYLLTAYPTGTFSWASDMIGYGTCYAVVTFQADREFWGGSFPEVQFEVGGVPLYDPRRDSTAGGVGAHRWGQPATYEPTTNFAVIAYNILRGIPIVGDVWGGKVSSENLPQSVWVAAMNVCDQPFGDWTQYQVGLEIFADLLPSDVLLELAKGAAAEFAEVGGRFLVRCGGPGLPVLFITDDDVIVDQPEVATLLPDALPVRGVSSSYPDPAALWEVKEAPLRVLDGAAPLESEVVALDLPVVSWPDQVQRLQRSYLEDHQRQRAHVLTLGPFAEGLEPLDVIAFTSARNGYDQKWFDVRGVERDPVTGMVAVQLRECDPDDYGWESEYEIPVDPIDPTPPAAPPATVPVGSVAGVSIPDADGTARRPGLRGSWSVVNDLQAVAWEARLAATQVVIARGSDTSPDDGEVIISEGVLPGQAYEVRFRPVMDRPTAWSAWYPATAPAVFLGAADLVPAQIGGISAAHYGPTAPSPTYPGMTWIDTSVAPPVLRVRNVDDDDWEVDQVLGGVPVVFRSGNTTYTNSSGRTMFVSIIFTAITANVTAGLQVDGFDIARSALGNSLSFYSDTLQGLVPPGSTFGLYIYAGGAEVMVWRELLL